MTGRDLLEIILVLLVTAYVAAWTSGGDPDRTLPDFDYSGISDRRAE